MALGVTVKGSAAAPVLQLYGDFGLDILATDVSAALASAGGRPLAIHLFSYGGDAGQGLAIYDILAGYSGQKTITIDGVAASSGSLSAMAGRVVMPANALLMIHNCWSMAVGDSASMRAQADTLDVFSAAFRRTYASKSGASEAQVAEWMAANGGAGTWFDAEAALAAGLIDEITPAANVRAQAYPPMPADRFINPPEALLTSWAGVGSLSTGLGSTTPPPTLAMTVQTQAGGEPATQAPQAAPPQAAATAPATTPTTPTEAVQAASDSAALAAARREIDIRRCAAQASLSADAVQALVDNGKPFAEVAVEIVQAHATLVEGRSSAGHPARLQVTRDPGSNVMAGIEAMLATRINPQLPLADAGRSYRGYSLMECIRTYAESRGISTIGRSRSELAVMAMHSTSDFPLLFSNLANKSLDAAYEEEPATWKVAARQNNLPDFKNASDLVVASDLTPELTLEGAEYRKGTLQEAQATWRLLTYTKKITVSRQAIINDDLSALERVPELLGRGFRRLESNLVWGLITGNAVTSVDGLALFAAGHNNTGTGAIGIASWNAAKKAMRKQTDISGVTVNLTPDFMFVPTDLEAAGLQFLYPTGYAPATATGANGPNPYARNVELITEPRLDGSATQWYAAAAPRRIDGLVYGYLTDEPGPSITQVPERDPDGLSLLARFDFGAAVKDWRFIYRSSGV
jgi:ATP-dependent protease ClpP protease subunit